MMLICQSILAKYINNEKQGGENKALMSTCGTLQIK